MRYISTRGKAPELSFEEAVLTGLASDGGLYVPKTLPKFSNTDIEAMAGLSYPQLAEKIILPFVGDCLTQAELRTLIEQAYRHFSHSAIAPLTQLDHNLYSLELFHGPTLAFKDFALQLLGQFLDFFLARRNQKVVIMGATSGDTGSAAIEATRHCKNIDIFILHPHNRVSDVQRKQMTTVLAPNVFNIALEGNFDDCQEMVKASFADQQFLPDGRQLVAVNSINWARIMAQIVYYFYAASALGAPHRKVSFSVPTGNFGDIYAGYLASEMGLDVEQLVVATNANDILHRAISDNDYRADALNVSLSPSMDIMVSSNFERLLFNAYRQDGLQVNALMSHFASTRAMTIEAEAMAYIKARFGSTRADDAATVQQIKHTYEQTGYVLDPHTAIGMVGAIEHRTAETPMVVLATAHPAKFPAAVAKAGISGGTDLPQHLDGLFEREERCHVMSGDLADVQAWMKAQLN